MAESPLGLTRNQHRQVGEVVRWYQRRRAPKSGAALPETVVKHAPEEMLVTAISNNYLTCKRVDTDGASYGSSIYVAKPRELRHTYTLYSGLTALTTTDAQTVSVTDGSTTETWKVTPTYIANATIIWALPVEATGVQVSDDEVVWLDVNVSSRAWAVEP